MKVATTGILFLSILWNLVRGEDRCKALLYLACMQNKAFTGHVIKTVDVMATGSHRLKCHHLCFMEDNCVSYNLGPVQGETRVCELSDTDHVMFPSNLVAKDGFEYCPFENPCSSIPCGINKVCSPDFTSRNFDCSDGRWTKWSGWQACACGLKNRTRSCVNPFTNASASDCPGSNLEKVECKVPGIEYPHIVTTGGKKCKFPFSYGGSCYHKCTAVNHILGYLWCAYTTEFVEPLWGHCP